MNEDYAKSLGVIGVSDAIEDAEGRLARCVADARKVNAHLELDKDFMLPGTPVTMRADYLWALISSAKRAIPE